MFSAFQEYSFEDIIRIGIAVVVILSGFLAIVYIIWGGFLMILSGGNEEKIKPAVNHIRHAVIGLVFLLAVLFIFPVLMNLVGLPYGEYLKPSTVFDTISEISGRMLGTEVGAPSATINSTDSSTNTLPKDFNDL